MTDSTSIVVPPLTEFCLRVLLDFFSESAMFETYLAPSLPPHLKRSIVRYAAIHEPLSSRKLYSLYEPAGHADGEVIVVGPQAFLRNDIFPSYHRSQSKNVHTTTADIDRQGTSVTRLRIDADDDDRPKSWDAEDFEDEYDDNTCIHTLILISTHLPIHTYLNLPVTLTRLALIDISTPVLIQRLPGICPRLVVLDLSLNVWLSSNAKGSRRTLQLVDWQKWIYLQVLGLRQCNVDQTVLKRINYGRFVDVEIVQ